ncbi:DUF4062 domain-containing protein [Methanobrevibacter sp.]|uniref:DUF4062 domain-containing protein n=1 Tax=Methanobrevibacter sp. TaxID=66852 RepID=UPI00388FBCCA
MKWEYAKIFISSSFIDMHAERDYLIKKVFPELEEWCEKYKIHLSTIDLRWGVPEDAPQDSTIEKCLLNIDESRPFFLCFLAQRRGWIPDFNNDISKETEERYEDIAKYEGRSATEMEIEHALLRPLKDFMINTKDNTPKEYLPTTHSLFFIRDKSSLNDITDAQKRVYTNYELVDIEKGEFDVETAKFVDLSDETKEIIRETDKASQDIIDEIIKRKQKEDQLPDEDENKVHIEITKYTGDWDTTKEIPAIEALTSNVGYKVVKRYVNDEWKGRLTNFKEIKENYEDISLIEESEDIESKIDRPLNEVIIEQLKEQLMFEFPENFEEVDFSSEEERILYDELNQQNNFAYLNSEGYIEIKNDIDILSKYVEDEDENRICLVSSDAGFGKTMLLANFANMLEAKSENDQNQKTIYKRFCGASNLSSKAFLLWDTIIRESEIDKEVDFKAPSNIDELKKSIKDILDRISKKGKSVIIIDAVNQMPDGLEMLKWLPAPETSNLKIIISCKEDDEDEYYAKKLKSIKSRDAFCGYFEEGHEDDLGRDYKNYSFKLKALEDCENEKTKIINSYLKNYLKELDKEDIKTICGFEASKNPLFLKVLLSELRVFASFEKLKDEIQQFTKNDFEENPDSDNKGSPKTAFNHVLERLEADEEFAEGEPLVPLIFSLLANARVGLSRDEMTAIIKAQTGLDEEYIKDTISLNLRQVKQFMARKEGRDDFFYESFKLAAQERYSRNNILRNEELKSYFTDDSGELINVNALLADYFLKEALGSDNDDYYFQGKDIRSYNELPYHINESRDFDRLKKVLSSYSFIKNKLELSDINNLIVDYQFKDFEDGSKHPFLEGEDDHSIVLIGRALELSAPILVDSKEELATQLYGRMIDLRDDEIIMPIIDEIEKEDSSNMLLKPKSNSLYSPKSSIIKRPKINGTESTSAIQVTDDKLLILANADGTLNVFDLENNDFEDSNLNSKIIKIIPSDDNRYMLIASDDGQINKWDINNRSIFKDDDDKYPKIDEEITDIYLSKTYKKIYASSHSGVFSIDLDTKELRKEDIEDKNYNQILVPRRNEAILVCDEREVDGWDVYEMRKAYNKQHQQNDDDESGTKLDSSEEIRFMGLNKRFLALISENGQMKFWNTLKNSGGGESIAEAQVCSPNDKFTQAITLEDENEIVTISDMGVMRVWDIPQPRSPQFDAVIDIQTGIKSPTAIDYHTDGTDRWIIVGNENNDISVIDLNKKVEKSDAIRHAESVLSVKIDGSHMITASDNGEIFTWDLDAEEFKNKFTNDFRCNSISYNREGSKLVLAGVKAEKDGRKTYKIASCTVSDDMWENSGNESIELESEETTNSKEIIDIAQNSSGIVFIEEDKLSIGGSETNFDKAATTLATKFDSDDAYVGFEDGSIVRYPSGDAFCEIDSPVTKIKVSGDKVIAGYENGSVEILDLDLSSHETLDAHEKAVTNFYVDESQLISLGKDNTIKFWDIGSKECRYIYYLDIFATSISLKDGKLVVGDALGNVRFFGFE